MVSFAELCLELERARSNTDRELALNRYLAACGAGNVISAEANSGLALLLGTRPKRLCSAQELKEIAAKIAGMPAWLVDSSCNYVGSVAEGVALLLPEARLAAPQTLNFWLKEYVRSAELTKEQRAERIAEWWDRFGTVAERIILNRIILGMLRVTVSRDLMGRALAAHLGLDAVAAAQKVSALVAGRYESGPGIVSGGGVWDGDARDRTDLQPLTFQGKQHRKLTQMDRQALVDADLMWMFSGLRVQALLYDGQCALFSEGAEFVTDLFPELVSVLAASITSGTVLEGTIIPARHDRILSQTFLERRLRATKPDKSAIKRYPVVLYLHDILSSDFSDLRDQPWAQRYGELLGLPERVAHETKGQSKLLRIVEPFCLSEFSKFDDLNEKMRRVGASAILAKPRTSRYGTFASRWSLFEGDEISLRAVAMYVERPFNIRLEHVYSLTLGVWSDDRLVPCAKCRFVPVSRESAEEFEKALRRLTRERFGPVRSLTPELVFQINAAGVDRSARSKSGVVLRGIRVVKWCPDSSMVEIGNLSDLLALLP